MSVNGNLQNSTGNVALNSTFSNATRSALSTSNGIAGAVNGQALLQLGNGAYVNGPNNVNSVSELAATGQATGDSAQLMSNATAMSTNTTAGGVLSLSLCTDFRMSLTTFQPPWPVAPK